jgi:hypothetical protein
MSTAEVLGLGLSNSATSRDLKNSQIFGTNASARVESFLRDALQTSDQ